MNYESGHGAHIDLFVDGIARRHTAMQRGRMRAIISHEFLSGLRAELRAMVRPLPPPHLFMTTEETESWTAAENARLDQLYYDKNLPDPVTGYVGTLFDVPIYAAGQPEPVVFEDAA